MRIHRLGPTEDESFHSTRSTACIVQAGEKRKPTLRRCSAWEQTEATNGTCTRRSSENRAMKMFEELLTAHEKEKIANIIIECELRLASTPNIASSREPEDSFK